MGLNCCATAGYLLYMRHASQTVKLCRHGCVFYNNLLSLPLLFFVIVVNGEILSIPEMLSKTTLDFFLLATFSGVIGFSISFTSFWCVGATSATTYAVVGGKWKLTACCIPAAFCISCRYHCCYVVPATCFLVH
jgi:GDP-mannose transporter